MRKFLAALIITLILCSASYAGVFMSFPAEGICTGDYVRYRARPGRNSKILGRLMDGDEVVVVGERRLGREVWYEIYDPSGRRRTAWIAGQYVVPADEY